MTDRFDLEQDILRLHNTSEDLREFCAAIIEGRTDCTPDNVWNHLYGLSLFLDLNIDKTFETFKKVHKLDGYSSTSSEFLS